MRIYKKKDVPMNTFIFFLLGFGYVFLLGWGLFLAKDYGKISITHVLFLVIFGLIYDNIIIAIGSFIGEGNVLEGLNYVRFWLHALFTPTLILFAWKIYYRTGFLWAKKKLWKILAFTITIGLIFYELFSSIYGLMLEPTWTNGVLTYESAEQSVSPVMAIIITLILGVIGLLLIIKYRFIWLFIGVLAMGLGGILAIWIKDFPIMNVSEFLFMISLLITAQFLFRIKNSVTLH